MKSLLPVVVLIFLAGSVCAQTAPTPNASPAPAATSAAAITPAVTTPAAPSGKLASTIFEWEKIPVTRTATGERRVVFDSPTATLDKVHCHITTLNPGERLAAPLLHLQEEIIIIKEGTIEATYDGHTGTASPGSIIYFASNATTSLRNVGTTPATYYVISYYTPLTPKPVPASAASLAR